VDRKSKHFSDAMYESAWNSIKSKDFKSAYRALDLMLLMDPESGQAPELRLLLGDSAPAPVELLPGQHPVHPVAGRIRTDLPGDGRPFGEGQD
jgi:hypothetical protein